MAKDGFGKDQVKEEAIPAAIKVKEEMLNVRTSAISVLSDIVFRNRNKQLIDKEISKFQANVVTLYQLLRASFPANHKIRKLDDVIVKNESLELKELYAYFLILDDKLYALKITKLTKRGAADGRELA